MSPSSCVHVSTKVSCVLIHLSHLFLLVVHRLSVLRAARRQSLPKAAQTQTATFFLLFVQNLILKTENSVLPIVAFVTNPTVTQVLTVKLPAILP